MTSSTRHRRRQNAVTLSPEEIQREVNDTLAGVRAENAEAELSNSLTRLFTRGVNKSDALAWATAYRVILHQREERDVIGEDIARALVEAMYGSSESLHSGTPSETATHEREPKVSKEDRLYAIAKRDLLLYKDNAGMFWAGIPQKDGSFEHISLDSLRVNNFLHARYRRDVETVVGSDTVRNVVATIQGDLAEDPTTHDNYVRLAWKEDTSKLYVDLYGNNAVEIDADGWRPVSDPPLYFRRPRGLLPQVEPSRGGSLDTLRDILQIQDERTWHLLVAFLISAYHPTGPYPVLVLSGEQGSGKTTIASLLGKLIDPQKAQVRKAPTKEDDVPVQAEACHLLAWDNLSSVPGWFSDVLCGLATGLTEARRKLYSDADLYVFGATKPTLVNGIEDLATRADLLSRALLVHLETMPKERRKELDMVNADFEAARPALLGAVFDAVSSSLHNKDRIRVKHPPRMADMANWVTRAEPALGWELGTYVKTFQTSAEEAASITLEASPLGQGLLQWLHYHPGGFDGYAARLLDSLNISEDIAVDILRSRGWPALPQFLTNGLRRITPALRRQGWDVEFGRDRKGARVTLKRVSGDAATAGGDAIPEVEILPEPMGPSHATPQRDAGGAGDAVFEGSSVPEKEKEEVVLLLQEGGARDSKERNKRHERYSGLRRDGNPEFLDTSRRPLQMMPASPEHQWSVTVPRTASRCRTCGLPLGSSPLACFECRAELLWRAENSRCRHQGSYTTGTGEPLPTFFHRADLTATQTCADCGTAFYCEEPEAHQTTWFPFGCARCDSEAARQYGAAGMLAKELEEEAEKQRLHLMEELTCCEICGASSWPHDLCPAHLWLDRWKMLQPDAMQGGEPDCEHIELREEDDSTLICDDCGGTWHCDHPGLYERIEGSFSCRTCGHRWEIEETPPKRLEELAGLEAAQRAAHPANRTNQPADV